MAGENWAYRMLFLEPCFTLYIASSATLSISSIERGTSVNVTTPIPNRDPITGIFSAGQSLGYAPHHTAGHCEGDSKRRTSEPTHQDNRNQVKQRETDFVAGYDVDIA